MLKIKKGLKFKYNQDGILTVVYVGKNPYGDFICKTDYGWLPNKDDVSKFGLAADEKYYGFNLERIGKELIPFVGTIFDIE